MAATQLSFSLRTTANVQSVHLIGSWDGYQGQLPLSRAPSKSAGAWIGTFRFQRTVLVPGERYWYYYIMDGYHVSHDPAKEHTVEPTTGRKLNVLDVPKSKSSKSSSHHSSKRQSRRYSREVPNGRSLSPSQIQSPLPERPGQTNQIMHGYTQDMLDQLSQQFAQVNVSDTESDSGGSDFDSVPSLTGSSNGSSRSSRSSSPSSVSSNSSVCTCERYGITRSGDRVKLDCGGTRCGYSSEECSSESDEEYDSRGHARRHGVVVRH